MVTLLPPRTVDRIVGGDVLSMQDRSSRREVKEESGDEARGTLAIGCAAWEAS